MKYVLYFACMFCISTRVMAQSHTEKKLKPSNKSFYAGIGLLGTISRPYETTGNEDKIITNSFNTGLLLIVGFKTILNDHSALNHSIILSNISPLFNYRFRNTEGTGPFKYRRERMVVPLNAAAFTYKFTAEYYFPKNKTNIAVRAGAATNFVFTQRATSADFSFLFQSYPNGEIRQRTIKQTLNRLSFDIPFEVVFENARTKQVGVGLFYNLAINPRSNGSFVFDIMDLADQSIKGNYTFIGSTFGLNLYHSINRKFKEKKKRN